ncbi:hypothetical protein PQQ96_04220 [Paraburkholderia sediminicola]|uniref:hypothetical protein n=1 Tax=Paraburkholderia sediminicola TaxID=458836 RepID=UPI0038BDEC33
MDAFASLACRLGKALLVTATVCAMAGCADAPAQILSRSPEPSPVVRTLTPDEQLQRADEIDHEVMREQRRALHDARTIRYGTFQPLLIDDGL